MNEVQALLDAWDAAAACGEPCAVATVVDVDGSAYRRPGARMLVSAAGATSGTISAGCLEGDVVEHALSVIRGGAAKVVEYDTASTSEEVAWGLGLGCGGVVRVLIEPLAAGSLHLDALRGSREAADDADGVIVATVFDHVPSPFSSVDARISPGARLVIGRDGGVRIEGMDGATASVVEREARALAADGITAVARSIDVEGGTVRVLIETLAPPVPLIVFGAGQDVLPVVELARGLGWITEVVDTHARPISHTRFAAADRVTLARPDEVQAHVRITPATMALVMSHDYAHDRAVFDVLLASPARYIGVMGPRERSQRMLAELGLDGGRADLARLHSPIGLDIGANSPAEVALSIIAEMRAALDGRRGGMLRDRPGPIHRDADPPECVPVSRGHLRSVAAA
ncbi:XdhC family protein [Longimicrobium terrae]|uniref:Xanthine/CO dehydrogenase XdhC/CoxF family maturation factor n=1 Tax=Longimicrobium terrae TaxID=1639882 RepID=A0A841H052_9BACT|nr:XdhC/CoxI family protein [Longimicrobium terrae]MBB4636992.1 xanthine/CO dehydrogenase XdhC/CoxF family maturation factor [Longimicrobium terrae]MBB6071400.1 xanthine/CO dehydrogenase XdhC/CoxF family maturation factor [Longimicrobium terrae]NNC31385.1 XdhC family protein [Longimicrobium terrae]